MFETSLDYFNNHILLFRSHLVIRGEAEAAAEDVRAHVLAGAGDVGVAAAAAVAFGRDEGMGAVDGLHMHGLPDGAALRVEGSQGIQDLMGRALSGFGLVQVVLLSTDHGRHGVLVDDQAGKPEVRLGIRFIEGIHPDRQIGEPCLIALVDGLLLSDMLIQIGHLATDDARDDVAHAVVIADLLMLIPGGGLPALGGPLAGLVRIRLGIGQEHAAGAAGDDLVAVEADAVVVAQGAGLHPSSVQLILCAQALGGILHDQRAVAVADGFDPVHLSGGAVEMSHHHQLGVWIQLERLLQGFRAHVPGVRLRVDEHGFPVLIGHGVDGSVEGHIRAEHPVPLQRALVRPRLAVELFAGQLGGQVQGRRAGRQAHRVLHADVFGDLPLHLVDVCADGGHPVGSDSIVHPPLLIPMHGGGGEPELAFKGLDPRESGIG